MARGQDFTEDQKKQLMRQVTEQWEVHKKKMADANPDLANLSDEEFNAKVKSLQREGNLRDPDGRILVGASGGGFSGFLTDVMNAFRGRIRVENGFLDNDGTFMGTTCFTKGTLITILKREYRQTTTELPKRNKDLETQIPIEEVVVGDVVLSRDENSGEVKYQKVLRTFIKEAKAIYRITFEDGTILGTTWNHPFRRLKNESIKENEFTIENSEWSEAKDLKAGDVTWTKSGKLLKITSIQIENRTEEVYNFEVDEFHTYFVTEVGIWVHNHDEYSKNRNKISFMEKTEEALDFANCSRSGMSGCTTSYDRDILSLGKDKASNYSDQKTLLELKLTALGERFIEQELSKYKGTDRAREEQRLRTQVDARISQQMRRFDAPVQGVDQVTGLAVRTEAEPIDVSKKFNEQLAKAEASIASQDFFDQIKWFQEAGKQISQCGSGSGSSCGVLDFKNTVLDDTEQGFTSYVKVNGRLVRAADLGNIAYGYLQQKYNPIFTFFGGSKVGSQFGNYTSQERFDPYRDKLAIECGYINCLGFRE